MTIAQSTKTPVGSKVQIYSMLLPYIYPKRRLVDDSDEERVVDVQATTPEEALDLARDLISLFGPRAATQRELSATVIEGDPNQAVEEDRR